MSPPNTARADISLEDVFATSVEESRALRDDPIKGRFPDVCLKQHVER